MNEISEINQNNDEIIDQINYRGFSFSVWQNSVHYYTVVAGKITTICDKNRNYRDYVYRMIDDQLDCVYAWDAYAQLVKFQNGDHTDVKLVYKNRILKVFLVADWTKVNETYLITESEKILKKLNIL